MSSSYDILGLPSTAKREDIKKAYRRLSLRYHPDRPGGNAEKYLVIRDAYEHLIKPNTAMVHDQYEHRRTPYTNIINASIDSRGDCVITAAFMNISFIESLSPLYYHWMVFGMNGGTLIIKKKDLEACGYKFTLRFMPIIGDSVLNTITFEDPRNRWKRFISKLKTFW